MDRNRYNEMMHGLVDSATEKILVLGMEGASQDLEKIRAIVDDLEMFWNEGEHLTGYRWSLLLDQKIEK